MMNLSCSIFLQLHWINSLLSIVDLNTEIHGGFAINLSEDVDDKQGMKKDCT